MTSLYERARAEAYDRALAQLAAHGYIIPDDYTHNEWCGPVWRAINDWKIATILSKEKRATPEEGWMK